MWMVNRPVAMISFSVSLNEYISTTKPSLNKHQLKTFSSYLARQPAQRGGK